ncbi:hypothetical protein ACPYPG_08300 [Streptomyces sp. FR-108]|uniref:hypothetical protein n=1 Tax=Streptomyces sp. FR-108 TaxID=3416665 RepID=UPI003CF72CD1
MSRGIKTEVAGVTLRSRPEAYWALFFEHLGIKWQYEPRRFDLADTTYTPDFYLPESRMWVEVKSGDFDLEIKFPKYVEAVATALSESSGLLLLGQNVFHQWRWQEDKSAYPVHTVLIPHRDSGVCSASVIFKRNGPVVLEGTDEWVTTESFLDRQPGIQRGRNPFTSNPLELTNRDPWSGVSFQRLAYMPSQVREAYSLDHSAMLESNPTNVETREEGLTRIHQGRVRGIGIMLETLNDQMDGIDGPCIEWSEVSGMHTESRKTEWHISQGNWSKAFKLHEVEPWLLQVYLTYDIDLPLERLDYKPRPGYLSYICKRLEAVRKKGV